MTKLRSNEILNIETRYLSTCHWRITQKRNKWKKCLQMQKTRRKVYSDLWPKLCGMHNNRLQHWNSRKIAETVKRCVKRRIRCYYYSYTDDTSYRLNYHDDYLEFRFFLAKRSSPNCSTRQEMLIENDVRPAIT